ncbi:MAG TPA: hypothetical protein VMV92_45610 [Streptosporangiaceae bacterium]|nr:hypothetical protein [Streptosporangiaceae bacterium]
MGSGLIDRRTVRLSQGLVIAGSLMLTLGLVTWLLAALGRVIPRGAGTEARLAALGLVVGGALCGLLMALVLLGADRVPRTGDPPPPASPPPPEAEPAGEARVWWRAANAAATSWDPDSSDEWLRSLRSPQAERPPGGPGAPAD